MVDGCRSAHGDRRAPSVRAVGELPRGLHEALVTEGLRDRLVALPDPDTADRRALTAAEAADRIAWHVSREIERSLADVRDEDRPEVGVAVARSLLTRLGELVDADPSALPIDPGTVLAAVLGRRIDGTLEPVARTILLFTRLRADDRAFWFLGPATYRGHVGEKPMAITWELAVPLPGDLYATFAAAVG